MSPFLPLPRQCEVVTGRLGHDTVRVIAENGREVLLHSLYDPPAEARAHNPGPVGARTLVFLGCGLGWHLPLVLADNPQCERIILVDIYRELATAASARPYLPPARTDLLFSPEDAPFPSFPDIPDDLDAEETAIIAHPPSIQAHPTWYAGVRAQLGTAGRARRTGADRRCKKTPLTVLALFGGYYCQNEAMLALERLGHRVVVVDYRGAEEGTVESFRGALLKEGPDLVFSVNMRGFDRHGAMTGMLERLGIPLACWFVDSPEFILHGDLLPPPSASVFFLWDRAYLPMVRALGYEAHYLPLAGDDEIMGKGAPQERFRAGLSFVGNALVGGFLSRLASRFPRNSHTSGLADRAVAEIAGRRGTQIETLATALEGQEHLFRGKDGELFFRAYCLHGATTLLRTTLLERLLSLRPVFFGDPDGWRRLFGPATDCRPDVHYYTETPSVYASSAVSFNATSLQMPMAVNQRVFDVPLSGGFLLTDRQEALLELFDPDETAVYDGPDDVAEKAAYYLAHPEERRRIAERARQRVLNEHTYRHRMGEMLQCIG